MMIDINIRFTIVIQDITDPINIRTIDHDHQVIDTGNLLDHFFRPSQVMEHLGHTIFKNQVDLFPETLQDRAQPQ